MKAIHLAAGKGTRLRPLTNDRPKPLVELGGSSLLERNVETLRAVGVEEHVVVTGHEGDQIRNLGFETVHNDVYGETEMVYSLFCAAAAFPTDEDLVISYGDIVYEERVAETLLACDSPMCVVVDNEWRALWEERFDDPLSDAEAIDVDSKGMIRSIGDDAETYDQIDTQYTGLLKVRSDHVDAFIEAYRTLDTQTDGYVSVDMTEFLQMLIDDGWDIEAVPVSGGWLEVDTTSDLERYRELYETEALSQFVSL